MSRHGLCVLHLSGLFRVCSWVARFMFCLNRAFRHAAGLVYCAGMPFCGGSVCRGREVAQYVARHVVYDVWW